MKHAQRQPLTPDAVRQLESRAGELNKKVEATPRALVALSQEYAALHSEART